VGFEKLKNMSSLSQKEVWERLEDESTKAYTLFIAFRDMGVERTVDKAAEQCGKSHSHAQQLSAKYHWRERAAAWDDEQQRQDDEQMAAARKAAVRRHVKLGQELQAKGAARLRQKSFKVQSARDVTSMIKAGAQLEASALGINRSEQQPQTVVGIGLLAQLDRDVNALHAAGHAALNEAIAAGKSEDEVMAAVRAACERVTGRSLQSQPVTVDSSVHATPLQLPEPKREEPSE
jgi:hypothetical protein